VSATLGASVSSNRAASQYQRTYADAAGNQHYTFAALDQRTLSLTADLGYTVTPALSLQWHVQPFVSRGSFSDVRELGMPGATEYSRRYTPYADTSVTNHPGGIDANVVLRWEYRPGSALFLVWTQGRSAFQPVGNPDGVGEGLRDLFDLRPDNTLLVKFSYWFTR
jgi:hypothetical protein